MQSGTRPSNRQLVVLASIVGGAIVAIITATTFWWIYELATGPDRKAAAQAALAPYNPSDNIRAIMQAPLNDPKAADPADTRAAWMGEVAYPAGVQAGQDYVAQFPQPKNIVVLKGMTTAQIWAYMQQHVSAALGVGCQYCHNIADFSMDIPQKTSARLMMVLVNQLNKQFITNLPYWRGNYVDCATCHNGKPVNLTTVNNNFVQANQPIKVIAEPLDTQGKPVRAKAPKLVDLKEAILEQTYNYVVWKPYDPADPTSGRGSLALNYMGGRTQDQVNVTQGAMNLFAWSLGVGCTYCHNPRNFANYELSTEAPTLVVNGKPEYIDPRIKAQRMLLMTTWMIQNWNKYVLPRAAVQTGAKPYISATGQHIRNIGGSYFSVPGCDTCHNGINIPKASLNQVDIPAGDAGIPVLPTVLRGIE
jgi:photosynthetic reaction center cytochrome c subunit